MSSANGCPNNNCVAHKKKTLFKTSMNFCPECGTKLAAVCKSKGCYTFLDDPSKKRCARCEAKRADRTDKIKKKGGMAVGALVAAAGTVVEIASLIKKKVIAAGRRSAAVQMTAQTTPQSNKP